MSFTIGVSSKLNFGRVLDFNAKHLTAFFVYLKKSSSPNAIKLSTNKPSTTNFLKCKEQNPRFFVQGLLDQVHKSKNVSWRYFAVVTRIPYPMKGLKNIFKPHTQVDIE